MSKPLGSITFGTTEMRTDEVVLFAEASSENGTAPEQILSDISLVDDLLCIQKVHAIISGQRRTAKGRLRKDSSMLDLMERRIDQEVENSKNQTDNV